MPFYITVVEVEHSPEFTAFIYCASSIYVRTAFKTKSFSLLNHFWSEGVKSENCREVRNVSGLFKSRKDKRKVINLILFKILQIQDDYTNIIKQATSTRLCLNSRIKFHKVCPKFLSFKVGNLFR